MQWRIEVFALGGWGKNDPLLIINFFSLLCLKYVKITVIELSLCNKKKNVSMLNWFIYDALLNSQSRENPFNIWAYNSRMKFEQNKMS